MKINQRIKVVKCVPQKYERPHQNCRRSEEIHFGRYVGKEGVIVEVDKDPLHPYRIAFEELCEACGAGGGKTRTERFGAEELELANA